MENKYDSKIDSDDTMNDVVILPKSEQHVNPDGETDAQKGAKLGGVGGAVTGAVAGSMLGVAGAAVGAAIGGVVGAVTSGLAVAQVDKVDGDSKNDDAVIILGEDEA